MTRKPFPDEVLTDLLTRRVITRESSILAVCAGATEAKIFSELGFTSVTLTNLDGRIAGDSFAFKWESADAQELPYANQTFDFGFVMAGIHHCSRPHKAVTELYRVCRTGIAVIEARDSALMRFANRLDLAPNYELQAVIYDDFDHGGVDNSRIPNFIFRWTEREFEKMIRSFDPTGDPEFLYFHRLLISTGSYLGLSKANLKALAVGLAGPVIESIVGRLFPKQGNQFAMIAMRPKTLFAWLKLESSQINVDEDYIRRIYKERTEKYTLGSRG